MEATFHCLLCQKAAGHVRLYAPGQPMVASERSASTALADVDRVARPPDQWALVVETFYGVESQPVSPERTKSVTEAIQAVDAGALYRLSYAYAPFHCPDCGVEYCGDHWIWKHFEDEFHSGVEGTCPRGHFHVLTY